MLNYAETASMRTIFPLESIPCSPFQDDVASAFSYVIGPLDPAHVIMMQAHLSTGDECSLLVPVHFPRTILDDPAFRDGYEYNYLSEEEGVEKEDWMISVTRLVNHVYASLTDMCLGDTLTTDEQRANLLPWQVGWLLRDLTRLAETDRTLAFVGIGHLCFLLPLLTQNRPVSWPRYEPYHPSSLHIRSVKAYRACIHFYRKQGKSYDEAQRLAL